MLAGANAPGGATNSRQVKGKKLKKRCETLVRVANTSFNQPQKVQNNS